MCLSVCLSVRPGVCGLHYHYISWNSHALTFHCGVGAWPGFYICPDNLAPPLSRAFRNSLPSETSPSSY